MAMAKDTMIWVVDDDLELRKMVGTYLIDQGYDVRSLYDVKQFEARKLQEACIQRSILCTESYLYKDLGTTPKEGKSKNSDQPCGWAASIKQLLSNKKDNFFPAHSLNKKLYEPQKLSCLA